MDARNLKFIIIIIKSVLSEKDERKLQKGMIITDDVSHYPILDFDDYVNALTNIIKKSYPKFSIGIYGEWGTGKTTLMTSIYRKLEENNKKLKANNEKISIIPVWFNAWRYEREQQFAIIPLLKTIAYDIPDEPQFSDLKQKIKKGGINFLKKIPDIIPAIAGHYFGDDVKNISQDAINGFKKEFIPKMELLAEVDKDTIYFDGLDNIQKELQRIRDKNDSFKIVVFVDDLDRCSPDKALQVLESIKVFLDMDGFIYVIGLSFNKISQLITAYYKEKYKEMSFEGDQYLKKIIQIPIILSDWNSDDVKDLIQDFIDNKVIVNEDYQKIIEENINLISTGLEENPRETKRFLNNFIVAQEIFSKKGTRPKELLVLQILKLRWNEIYRLIVNSSGKYLITLKEFLDEPNRLKELRSTKAEDLDGQPELKILQTFGTDQHLWKFIGKNYDIMNKISNWSIYRRATKISEEPQTPVEASDKSYTIYGKIFDSTDSPLQGVSVRAYQHIGIDVILLATRYSASDGLFKFTFTNEHLIYPPSHEGTIKVFLNILDTKDEFLSVQERRNGRLNMCTKSPDLLAQGAEWKGSEIKLLSSPYLLSSPHEVDFIITRK